MLKMRLQRIGRRNDPSYRVIVCDSRQGPKSGKFIDLLGSYNAKMNRVQIDGEKAKEWIAKGVQVSPTVHNLLVSEKIIEGKKVNVLPKKSPIIAESEEVTEEAADVPAEEDGEGEAEAVEEAPAEESSEEKVEEAPAEEAKEESPAEEEKKEEPAAA